MTKLIESVFPQVNRLQEAVDRRLALAPVPDAKRLSGCGGELSTDRQKVINEILISFDAQNAHRLMSEEKRLSGGSNLVSDSAVPAIFERTVLRESLYQMRALEHVNAGPAPFGGTIAIPYSYRDTTAAGRNDTRKYEGQEINRAGVIQASEEAYQLPQKLAFSVSDELRHLSSAQHLNWNVVEENQKNSSRIIAEDTDRAIYNEILHAADEYGAASVTGEDLELQADDVKTIFILAHFPVVRPRAVYDLQGNQVGSTVNGITVTYNAVALDEYDGTGTQAAGTYYVIDYNLGEIYLVDESGAVQTPANGTAYTISYSYATNCYAFDTDEGAVEIAVHWDTFLYRYGLRKAVIESDRYYMANMGLMSGTAMTQIEQAKKFAANFQVPGTSLSETGDLGMIKNVPNFKTSGPGLWCGDQRILIGERGITRYRLTKPWAMSALIDQRGPNGRFTGMKEAYGDQFIVVHTPTQLKKAYTSLVLYSATERVAR